MANAEQVAQLRQGVASWNAWRRANADITVDLRGAPLAQADLTQANLRGANLRGATLTQADLTQANLRGAELRGANLRGATLTQTTLTQANLIEATLSGADLRGAELSGADLREANLIDANLSGADLREATLREANLKRAELSEADLRETELIDATLTRANLRGAELSEADLTRANLTQTNLIDANLRGAILKWADLSGADLSGADLSGANLSEANLTEANLSRADLKRADLTQANLSGANLNRALIGRTIFANVDLGQAVGLAEVRHAAPSTIGVDTLVRSHGKIPEAFLRGCGVPDSLIEYLPSLIGAMQPIQFYSCFISYSSADEAFAKRLHERLQAEHLRVWFAPEELKGGQKLREQIDSAIRVYDKLLLIISDASMASNWVTHEVRRAYQEEHINGKRILFPIRLNDFETLKQWALPDDDTGQDLAVELRRYYIPNFSNWKDHDAFEAAFTRLLAALRATETKS